MRACDCCVWTADVVTVAVNMLRLRFFIETANNSGDRLFKILPELPTKHSSNQYMQTEAT